MKLESKQQVLSCGFNHIKSGNEIIGETFPESKCLEFTAMNEFLKPFGRKEKRKITLFLSKWIGWSCQYDGVFGNGSVSHTVSRKGAKGKPKRARNQWLSTLGGLSSLLHASLMVFDYSIGNQQASR